MRWLACITLLALAVPIVPAVDPAAITWKKTTLDDKFHSEGVAIADVNNDGQVDVLVGEYWYEAPNWTRHEMQTPGDYGDGLRSYSKVFCCWAQDFNNDGYLDCLVIAFPGEPCYWLENPKGQGTKDGKPTHWKKHIVWHSACNETPQYVDLFGNGQRVLLMGFQPENSPGNIGQMAYFTPDPKDPTAKWIMHPISEPSTPPTLQDGKPVAGTHKEMPGTQKFSHGLGIGDLNGNGRMDVLTIGGWWEHPEKPDGKTPWKLHRYNMNEACADIYVMDVDNDGKADILNTSAHRFGIWWHKQRSSGESGAAFEKRDIFKEMVSETHAANFVDIDGDGQKDLVTGKRWWSHGRAEPGSDGPALITWLRITRDKDGMATFTPYTIDDNSGIGTQFVVADINGDGLLDVISSNKKGVHVIVQVRK